VTLICDKNTRHRREGKKRVTEKRSLSANISDEVIMSNLYYVKNIRFPQDLIEIFFDMLLKDNNFNDSTGNIRNRAESNYALAAKDRAFWLFGGQP
jgi:hypothetical protein